MTAKELVFAASHLGTQNFYGLPDPFYGMEDGEIVREVTQLQLSLTQKGIADMGFDDDFSITSKASELISVCADCSAYVTAEFESPGGKTEYLVFYYSDGKAAQVRASGDDLTLEMVAADAVAGLLWAELCPPNREDLPSDAPAVTPAVISFDILTQAQNKSETDLSGAAALLCAEGCPEPFAQILIGGLTRTAGFCSIHSMNMQADTFDSMLFIRSNAGVICLLPFDAPEETFWEILPASGDKVRKRVSELCDFSGSRGERDNEMH